MNWNFDYGCADIRDFHITSSRDSQTGKAAVRAMELNGRTVVPTKRFWKSLFLRFGIGDTVFRYFDHAEVFERISQRGRNERVRWCIAENDRGEARLLAVSSPKRPLITHAEVDDLLQRYGGRDVRYHDGVVTSTHTPRGGERPFEIGGDRFQHRFVMETPVDGFSHPKVYLSFLRQVCANGAVGYGRAFRSDVSLGKDIGMCISRALDSYDNEEGYAALRQRFESSQTSWASVRECRAMTKLLEKIGLSSGGSKEHLRRTFHRMTGNLNQLYGLANLDALSNKRQRVLPSRCRVYDLINFASEAATHHSTPGAAQSLQGLIGTMICDEYDLEGTATSGSEFVDLFIRADDSGPRVSVN
jgi:hypothetical protein